MFTFCPSCHATFRLTTRQLAKAGGRARCGECNEIYSAVDHLFEELDETREAREQHKEQLEALAAAVAQEQVEAAAEQLAETETAEQAESAATELLADSTVEEPEVPSLKVPAGDWSQSSLKMPTVFSGVAAVLLVLLAGAQWVFFNRAELAENPEWRPHLEQICSYLHCDLPMQVDLAQLELLNRDVRQHPRVEEALLVNATLSNRAEFTQPFPVLEVSFSDRGGNTVAARRFRPIEYIIDSYTIKRGMLPGEPVPVVLEIVDPGEVAASYQFGFL